MGSSGEERLREFVRTVVSPDLDAIAAEVDALRKEVTV